MNRPTGKINGPETASKAASTTAETRPRLVFVSIASAQGRRSAPLGAAQVLAYLFKQPAIREAFRMELLELDPQASRTERAAAVLERRPDILAISLYTWNRQAFQDLSADLRPALPGLCRLAGGPEASGYAASDPQGPLAHGLADYVIQGEGETATAAWLEDWLTGRLPAPDSPPDRRYFLSRPVQLDSLPSPWLDGILRVEDYGGVVWEQVRGCPYNCDFCYESRGSGNRIRPFPEARLERELRHFRKHGAQELFILDPSFNASGQRLEAMVKLLRRLAPDLPVHLELRAELVTEKQARLLAGLNCSVQLGLQSADPAVLAQVNRRFDPEDFYERVLLLAEAGIVYGLDLVYGLPGDCLDGFRASLDYALELRPNHLDIFPLAVLPGTALAEKAASLGLRYQTAAPHLVVDTPGFPAADLERAARLSRGLDLFYNQGRAVMWFQALCAALGSRAADLLDGFSASLSAGQLDPAWQPEHRELESLQLDFIGTWGSGTAGQDLSTDLAEGVLDLCLDMIRASGAWTRALAEGTESELSLGWPPDELLDLATSDPEAYLAEAKRRPFTGCCRPGPQGPTFAARR